LDSDGEGKMKANQVIDKMRSALSLFVVDRKLYHWLSENDPDALKQVCDALECLRRIQPLLPQ
jgi:hypothetical protein